MTRTRRSGRNTTPRLRTAGQVVGGQRLHRGRPPIEAEGAQGPAERAIGEDAHRPAAWRPGRPPSRRRGRAPGSARWRRRRGARRRARERPLPARRRRIPRRREGAAWSRAARPGRAGATWNRAQPVEGARRARRRGPPRPGRGRPGPARALLRGGADGTPGPGPPLRRSAAAMPPLGADAGLDADPQPGLGGRLPRQGHRQRNQGPGAGDEELGARGEHRRAARRGRRRWIAGARGEREHEEESASQRKIESTPPIPELRRRCLTERRS